MKILSRFNFHANTIFDVCYGKRQDVSVRACDAHILSAVTFVYNVLLWAPGNCNKLRKLTKEYQRFSFGFTFNKSYTYVWTLLTGFSSYPLLLALKIYLANFPNVSNLFAEISFTLFCIFLINKPRSFITAIELKQHRLANIKFQNGNTSMYRNFPI